ncbi:MAG: transposase [Gemmataceae bacterium]
MPDGPATPELNLPQDVAVLQGMICQLLATLRNERLRNERPRNDQLANRLDLLLKRLYGPRVDRVNPNQLSLLDEPPPVADVPVSPSPTPPTMVVVIPEKKPGHGRQKLPENL